MGQQLVKRETSPETKALSDEANLPTTDSESQDEVFGLNDSDVNQNKNRSNKSETAGSAPPSTSQNTSYWPRPHLARLFSRDAPGREDNTFKERPSESDELHTIEEAGAGASENAE